MGAGAREKRRAARTDERAAKPLPAPEPLPYDAALVEALRQTLYEGLDAQLSHFEERDRGETRPSYPLLTDAEEQEAHRKQAVAVLADPQFVIFAAPEPKADLDPGEVMRRWPAREPISVVALLELRLAESHQETQRYQDFYRQMAAARNREAERADEAEGMVERANASREGIADAVAALRDSTVNAQEGLALLSASGLSELAVGEQMIALVNTVVKKLSEIIDAKEQT